MVPKKEKYIWKRLLAAGYETYLVGGAVRDILSGESPKDFDFVTKARPHQIITLFRSHDVNYVGKSFGVVIVDGIEIATFRGDRYFGGSDKNVEISYVDSIEQDLKRRDLTINAIAMNIDGQIIDPFNGKKDINDKVIRFVGDPYKRIDEDPNRIIRAIRFFAKIQGKFCPMTINALRKCIRAGYINKISPERIRAEILKAMEIEHASFFWKGLIITEAIKEIFPEMEDGVGHEHGRHHIEPVFNHNMIAGDSVSIKYPLVKLAAYLHDIGKPAAYNEYERTFNEHQKFGADIVRRELKKFKFSNEEIRKVVNLILIHMDGTRNMTSKARRKLKNKLEKYGLDWREWLRLRIADRKANLAKYNFTFTDLRKYVNNMTYTEQVPLTPHSLSLSGGEIISLFGLTPGPIVSMVQKRLLEYVINTGDDNKESLIEEANKFLEKWEK